MSTALAHTNAPVVATGASLAPVPWRDPHSVSPRELSAYIQKLEQACLDNPRSADLRTYLGMAHAVNYDVDKSMDALEAAVGLEPDNFWAQLKHSELLYRLRVLNRAEEGTLKALNLANDPWQLSVARNQLQRIRTLKHSCVRNVEWSKPLTLPALALAGMMLVVFVVMMWR